MKLILTTLILSTILIAAFLTSNVFYAPIPPTIYVLGESEDPSKDFDDCLIVSVKSDAPGIGSRSEILSGRKASMQQLFKKVAVSKIECQVRIFIAADTIIFFCRTKDAKSLIHHIFIDLPALDFVEEESSTRCTLWTRKLERKVE